MWETIDIYCHFECQNVWKIEKHMYECKQSLWKCNLCGQKNITTKGRTRHLKVLCAKIQTKYKTGIGFYLQSKNLWTRYYRKKAKHDFLRQIINSHINSFSKQDS